MVWREVMRRDAERGGMGWSGADERCREDEDDPAHRARVAALPVA